MQNRKGYFLLSKGFSLVELLVVISVIAIIAAIAIPNIAGIRTSAEDAKTKRNAQSLATAYNAAVAAGLTNSVESLDDAISLITDGVSVRTGNVATQFKVDGLTPAEVTLAKSHLSLLENDGLHKTLVYSN